MRNLQYAPMDSRRFAQWNENKKTQSKTVCKKLIFVFWCLGGENVFAQNVVDRLEGKEFRIKTLNN